MDVLIFHTITSTHISLFFPLLTTVHRTAPGDSGTRWRRPHLWSDQASYYWPPSETHSHGRISTPVQLVNKPERRNKHTESVYQWPSCRVTSRTTTDPFHHQAPSEVLGSFRRFLAGLVDQVVCGLWGPWPGSVLLGYGCAFYYLLVLWFGKRFIIPQCINEFMLSGFHSIRLQSLNQSHQ